MLLTVFGSVSTPCRLLCLTLMIFSSKSTSSHFKPISSPVRIPVKNPRAKNAIIFSSAPSNILNISSILKGFFSLTSTKMGDFICVNGFLIITSSLTASSRMVLKIVLIVFTVFEAKVLESLFCQMASSEGLIALMMRLPKGFLICLSYVAIIARLVNSRLSCLCISNDILAISSTVISLFVFFSSVSKNTP